MGVMSLNEKGTFLITGCSSGLGRALAEQALRAGHRVVATARDPGRIADLQALSADRLLIAPLDVTDADGIQTVLTIAQATFGGIDVLINNAGHGYIAAVEEGDGREIQSLMETNFFSAARLIRACLPGMRKAGFGRIVNIASVAAHAPNAGAGYYAASKAALTALSRALALEVAPFGIRVTTFHPGPFPTEFSGRSMKFGAENPAYRDTPAGQRRRQTGPTGSSPDEIAALILQAIWSDTPPMELLIGKAATRRVTAQIAGFTTENAVWADRVLAID